MENRAPDPTPYPRYRYLTDVMIGDIIEGCPKLKTLTLEPLESGRDLTIEKKCLKKLLESGKELETLRIIKGYFPDLFNEKEVKEILPTCNVEMEECKFNQGSSAYKSPFITLYHVYDSDWSWNGKWKKQEYFLLLYIRKYGVK